MAFFAASLLSEIWETSQSNTAAGLFKPQTLKKSRSLSQLSRPGTQGQLHEGDSSDEVAQSIEHRLPYTSDKNIPELTDIDGCSQDSALPELKKPDLALRIDLAAEVDETDRSAECCGIAQSPSVADIAACSTGSETDCTASRGTTKFPRMEEVHERYRRPTCAGPGAALQSQLYPPEVIDSTVSDDDGVRNRPERANRK